MIQWSVFLDRSSVWFLPDTSTIYNILKFVLKHYIRQWRKLKEECVFSSYLGTCKVKKHAVAKSRYSPKRRKAYQVLRNSPWLWVALSSLIAGVDRSIWSSPKVTIAYETMQKLILNNGLCAVIICWTDDGYVSLFQKPATILKLKSKSWARPFMLQRTKWLQLQVNNTRLMPGTRACRPWKN